MSDIETEHHNLMWGVRRSIRYHSRRQGFFQNCHTAMMVLVVLAGSGTVLAFGSALGEGVPLVVKLLPALGITVFGAFDLVVGFSRRTWQHAGFVRQFTELEKQLEACRREPDPGVLESVRDQRLTIEATEPPVLNVLNTICHNELPRAMGYEQQHFIKIGFFQRRFAQFFDLGEHRLNPS